jgi:cbb3-type cytochrome oxidase subunit 3
MLTVFASVVLAFSAVLFFAWNVRGKSHEHTEHLSLLPLNDDDDPSVPEPRAPKGTPPCS